MKKYPIALQLYSVRDFLQNDFEGTLKKVKAMGYTTELNLPVSTAKAARRFVLYAKKSV